MRTPTAGRSQAYKVGVRAAQKSTNDNEEVGLADERFSRARFIRLGAALGVGAAGASVIAACGGGGEGASNGGGGAATTEAAPTSGAEETTQPVEETTQATEDAPAGAGGDAIAGESEVPPGTAVPFDEAGGPAILVHLQSGDFAAYSAVCTHAQCTVAYQEQSAQIACPCHGSVFDPANGAAVVNGPAQMPLSEIPVEVRDGQVFRA